ncbi:MAG: sigma-70 family RNA polymerase sigma factor [Myxococcales bacterium]
MSQPRPIARDELERLYQRFGGLVLRRARRILVDEQLARDVCHDVFVRILRLDPWAPPSPLAWLYVTTTNLCLNLLRTDRRRRAAFARLPRPDGAPPPTDAGLLLERVPPQLREIAIYYAVDQMSQDEIALVLGLSQKTVSNRIRELRALLDPADPLPSLVAK